MDFLKERGWTENKCSKCGSHIGFGDPRFHVDFCDDCDEEEVDESQDKRN